MKLILIILLAASCGKNHQTTKYYQVSEESLSQDSDGDGILDWDEIHSGNDPLMANAPIRFQDFNKKVILIDQNHKEIEVRADTQRTIRAAILRSYINRDAIDIPLSNQNRIAVNEAREFWAETLNETTFKKIRLKDHSGSERIFLLPDNFNLKGIHFINEDFDLNSLQKIHKKTYRLVVSFPEIDYIYHLHPSVSPADFLNKHHKISYNRDNEVIAIDGVEQLADHPINLDASEETKYWISNNCIQENQARFGETCYLAFTSLHELKQSSKPFNISGLTLPFRENNLYGHKTKLLIMAPIYDQLGWKLTQDSVSWDIGSGDRAREATCTFRINEKPSYSAVVADKDFLINSFEHSGLSQSHVSWFIKGEKGSAMLIELYALPEEHFIIENKVLQNTIPIGIFQSGCPKRVPVNVSHYPLYKNLNLQFYWIRESL